MKSHQSKAGVGKYAKPIVVEAQNMSNASPPCPSEVHAKSITNLQTGMGTIAETNMKLAKSVQAINDRENYTNGINIGEAKADQDYEKIKEFIKTRGAECIWRFLCLANIRENKFGKRSFGDAKKLFLRDTDQQKWKFSDKANVISHTLAAQVTAMQLHLAELLKKLVQEGDPSAEQGKAEKRLDEIIGSDMPTRPSEYKELMKEARFGVVASHLGFSQEVLGPLNRMVKYGELFQSILYALRANDGQGCADFIPTAQTCELSLKAIARENSLPDFDVTCMKFERTAPKLKPEKKGKNSDSGASLSPLKKKLAAQQKRIKSLKKAARSNATSASKSRGKVFGRGRGRGRGRFGASRGGFRR